MSHQTYHHQMLSLNTQTQTPSHSTLSAIVVYNTHWGLSFQVGDELKRRVGSSFELEKEKKSRRDMGSPRTPLLGSSRGEEERIKGGIWGRFIDLEEAKDQILFSVPIIITNVSYYFITLVSVMFAGHLGELELAGSTLANSCATVTGLVLMSGLSGALETLCGQGYGANMYRMLGVYLQASLITTFCFSILVSFIWFYSEPILLLCHQDPQVANVAAIYMRHLIPGLFAYGLLQCILRFLQTQSVVLPLVVCSVVPLVIHFGITYVLVYCADLGVKGAALSSVISLWISVIMLVVYMKYSLKLKHTWDGFSTECFEHVIPSMKLAIPSAIMMCLECWAFELLVLLAGLMPNSETSTSLIAMCVTTEAVTFMMTFGFSAAVSTRVSNELGAGNVNRAKNAVAVTLKLWVILALTVILCLLFGHNFWSSLFSNSPKIKKEFASMTTVLAISMVLDTAQGVLSGVSRGCGWQHLAAWTNLGAFYILGFPLALLFGFKFQLYAKGLWIGMTCGLFCQAVILLLITTCTNWAKLDLSVTSRKEKVVIV